MKESGNGLSLWEFGEIKGKEEKDDLQRVQGQNPCSGVFKV